MSDIYDLAPKVELHLHLEGTIPLDTLLILVDDPEVRDRESLVAKLAYRDFVHFIETWVWMTVYLQTEDAFVSAAEAVARDLVRQNIVYAEASFSPIDYAKRGLSPQQIAIRKGLARVPEATVSLNCDLVPRQRPRARRTHA